MLNGWSSGFQTSSDTTGLYNQRRGLGAGILRFENNRDCTTCTCVVKTKALISCAVIHDSLCPSLFLNKSAVQQGRLAKFCNVYCCYVF